MSAFPSATRTLLFAAGYLLAAYAGRLTVMDGTNLSLVWPAAGVAIVWFAAQRRARWPWLDTAALVVVTLAVNLATGASPVLAAAFAVANVVQVHVFFAILRRLGPHLWGAGGTAAMSRVSDLWHLGTAAAGATIAGAALGPTAVWLLGSGGYSPWATGVWLTRNTVSIMLISTVGLRAARYLSTGSGCRLARLPGRARTAWRQRRRLQATECAALIVCSATVYVVGFAAADGLPLSFLLLSVTIWAALRFSTSFVVLHDLAVGTIAVLFTLHGHGPFAGIANNSARALVAQAFVGMVAVVGLALALRRDEKDTLLGELRAQAGLLRTIIDSMNDGLGVVDGSGRFVLRNPAATRLLGGGHTLARPDGRAVADHEGVDTRALEDGTDLLVRDGRTVNVRVAALPADGGPQGSAVVVFTDVTAERRHRDDLAAFAGVVAHDLLNPVATVEGWSEELAETLAEIPPHPAVAAAEDSAGRVRRAAARMRTLINDLLAYTTARDAALHRAPADLAALVTDVAAARIDAATGARRPAPVITIDARHRVHADPVLLHQLLDNLLGNAIKYAVPGVVPRISVTSAATGGLVTVDVIDNGMGIPAGQHDAIFTNFHRAHAGSGVPGTGLGLTICRRITERHGGTITARDNPAGGARITFTLPAAV